MSASSPSSPQPPTWVRIRRIDTRLRTWMARRGPAILRVSLGLVFLWFGLLKVMGASPAAPMVERTLSWLPADVSVPLLGWIEAALGLGLIAGVGRRIVIGALWLHLLGTFLVFALQPQLAFRDGNPLLLTLEGEFVVKNLVLASAGLIILARAPSLPLKPPTERQSGSDT